MEEGKKTKKRRPNGGGGTTERRHRRGEKGSLSQLKSSWETQQGNYKRKGTPEGKEGMGVGEKRRWRRHVNH